jgi:hypothetical protein
MKFLHGTSPNAPIRHAGLSVSHSASACASLTTRGAFLEFCMDPATENVPFGSRYSYDVDRTVRHDDPTPTPGSPPLDLNARPASARSVLSGPLRSPFDDASWPRARGPLSLAAEARGDAEA